MANDQPKPNKKLAFIVRTVIGCALLLFALGITLYLVKTKPQISKSTLETQPIRVQVIRVEPVDVARQWRGYGTTQAKDSADVPARVSATVVEIPESVEEGKVVKAGQAIARLDPTDFRLTLQAAEKRIAEAKAQIEQIDVEKKRLLERRKIEEKDVALARADYERQAKRLNSGSAAQTDVDRTQRALLTAERALLSTNQQIDAIAPRLSGLEALQGVAQADLDTAKTNLKRTIIISPIDGVIESLDVEVGENLTPGARVARIVDPRVIELPLKLPASARSYITKGNTVTITTRSHPDDCPPWQAEVTRLGATDGPTRTFSAFAEIDQSHVPLRNFAEGDGPYKLSAGAFALARLDTAEPEKRIVLPTRAIQEGRVRVIRNGEVVGVPVEVAFDVERTFETFGVPDTQWVVLKNPLPEGDLVVLSASMTILDGQPVEPVIANPIPTRKTSSAVESP